MSSTQPITRVALTKLRPEEVDPFRKRADPLTPETLADVAAIIARVRDGREEALLTIAKQLGDVPPSTIALPALLTPSDFSDAMANLDAEARTAIEAAASRIRTFAQAQRQSLHDVNLPVPGGHVGHRITPVERAACYVPAGQYPLVSTALMTILTAKAAGVREVFALCPRPSQAILAACAIAGADALLPIGGAQAIAAAAHGVAIRRCDVVVGPGNRYVTAAKKLLTGTIGIDMLAGPSEVLIIADLATDPKLIAADMLAQLEHDGDASAMLVRVGDPDGALLAQVEAELERQLATLPTAPTARKALARSFTIGVCSTGEAVVLANVLSPEHLQLLIADCQSVVPLLTSYGGLFVGPGAAEVFGDYGIGPNHTLPTSGSARFASGLSVLHFLRFQTYYRAHAASAETGAIQDLIRQTATLARLEGLEGHVRAAEYRIRSISATG